MFNIHHQGHERTVTRQQLPSMTSYAFTDYQSQGQTISATVIDSISIPPTGELTTFNIYVSLSCSCEQNTTSICLL
jgi:hypothetical protein